MKSLTFHVLIKGNVKISCLKINELKMDFYVYSTLLSAIMMEMLAPLVLSLYD